MPNRVALSELIDQHYGLVYRYAYRLSGSTGDAEDLTQQTFLQAQTCLEQLREASAAKGWLCAIARNAYLQMLRSQSRQLPLEAVPEPVATPPAPPDIDPVALQAALNELPEEFRTPLVLFYFREFSYREIADQLRVPLGTVMSRLARGKDHLRRRLSQHHDESAAHLSAPKPAARLART